MSYRILTMVGAGVLVPSIAFAQGGPAPEMSGQQGSGVVYEDETAYDFDDEYVDGQVVRPDGELISGQRHGKESSLIRIRADFIPEMVESVEDL
jgi:hypothetical protein